MILSGGSPWSTSNPVPPPTKWTGSIGCLHVGQSLADSALDSSCMIPPRIPAVEYTGNTCLSSWPRPVKVPSLG
jgi:hypothetical protein